MNFFKAKVLLWPLLLMMVLALGAGVLVAMYAASWASPFGLASDERNSQVVKSITKEEQVVLLGLGIEGIDEKRQNGTFFGVPVPGSERATFLRYSFDAKLGIEGKDVEIDQRGENSFLVTVPEFIFVGIDNHDYDVAVESNGILSWTTAEIDELEMVNNVLNDEVKAAHIESNIDALKDQARRFYSGIIESIDPDVDLEFQFGDKIGSSAQ